VDLIPLLWRTVRMYRQPCLALKASPIAINLQLTDLIRFFVKEIHP